MNYLEAFKHHAKEELPGWQYDHLHGKAMRTAGGYASPRRPQDEAGDDPVDVLARDPVAALCRIALAPHPLFKLTKREDRDAKPVIDASKTKQVVLCVALEPDSVDSQGDTIDADTIEDAAHDFVAYARTIGRMHEGPMPGAELVESYIAHEDLQFPGGMYGDQTVKKGSWIVGIRINKAKDWAKVLSGEYTGVSIGGIGRREAVKNEDGLDENGFDEDGFLCGDELAEFLRELFGE